MTEKAFYVAKRSGTFADTLVAFGLAALLDRLLGQILPPAAPRRVRLSDQGPYFLVEPSQPILENDLQQLTFFDDLVPFVKTARIEPDPGASMVRDYQAEWDKFQRYVKLQQTLSQTARRGGSNGEVAESLAEAKPLADFWTLAHIGDFRMQAVKGYTTVVRQWLATRDHFVDNIRTILRLHALPDVDIDVVARDWSRAVGRASGISRDLTASQIVNPAQGKGQNQPKANALKMTNEKSFWLLEYLKAAGLWVSSAPRVVRGSDDRKVYVLVPTNLSLAAHQTVFREFQSRLWSETAVKMDVIAALLYSQQLLEYSTARQQDELDFEGEGPDRVVGGFQVATYKLLSANAYSVINLAFVGLPRWITHLVSRTDVDRYQTILVEHLGIIRNIDEERAEGYHLLECYRDFLSAGSWSAFFEFTTSYGQYLMQELQREHRWVRPLTITNLEEVIMRSNQPLSPILANDGFRNIAAAIRRSTIIPQYIGRRESKYDVRYGLGQDLKRKAHYNDEFIAALSDFMHGYNAENARVYEQTNRKVHWRKNVQTSDIEEIVKLVDTYGAEVVANLLVAFGYARDPREPEPVPADGTSPSTEEESHD